METPRSPPSDAATETVHQGSAELHGLSPAADSGGPKTEPDTSTPALDNEQIPVLLIETMSERPIVPTSATDWESKKHIIRELYMDQNMILNEVIEIMVRRHRFKAT